MNELKRQWKQLAAKIDAYSQRERIIFAVTGALALFMLVNLVALEPMAAQKKKLREQIRLESTQIEGLEAERLLAVQQQSADPDAANRARLQQLSERLRKMHGTLLELQKGLVPPARMASMLEDILRRNGKLKLVALDTLPPVNLLDPKPAEPAPVTPAPAPAVPAPAQGSPGETAPTTTAAIYKHGVVLTLQGNYLDMLRYMADLEATPWQLYWGSAKMNVGEDRQQATLTLILHTLSLDKKWLDL